MSGVELVIIVGVVVVIALGAGAFLALRNQGPRGGTSSAERAAAAADTQAMTRPRPKLGEFHVRGEDALAYFEVPLPAEGADAVLKDFLIREAVEVVHEKQSHDLPMDQLMRVRAFGRQGGQWAEVGSIELEQPGKLPRRDAMPDITPHASVTGFDPLADVAEQEFKVQPGVADVGREKGLAPIGKELRLAGSINAGLRGQGLDPAVMSVTDLTLALLRFGGYAVSPAGEDGYTATRAGSTTFLRTVDHQPGEYPELDESAVTSFLIAFAERNVDRGLLISDKFGPFVVYEKERREPRVKFITRERLQAFVDSFVAG